MQRWFSHRPSEWWNEEEEAKKREHLVGEVNGMKGKDKQAEHMC